MFGREKSPAGQVDTLIGAAVRIQGDLEFTGGLHLDGRVAGSVGTPDDGRSTLSVSEDAHIEGSVRVPQVVLHGTVNGDIYAHVRLVLGPKARVAGNVFYGVIEMAAGADVRGKLIPAARLNADDAVQSEAAS